MDNRITELKNAVNDSTQMIQSQLQGIESNLLGAFVAVIASALLSNNLGIIRYWATSSFILMWIIFFNSFITSYTPWLRKLQRQQKLEQTEKTLDFIAESPFERFVYLFSITAKNSVPFFRAIGITFFITFITFLIPNSYIIPDSTKTVSITIPIISSLLFISLPFLLHFIIPKLETSELKKGFAKLGCMAWFVIIIFVLLFSSALMILPIWSLVSLLPLYTFGLNTSGLFLVVIALQAITALTFINYFSANMVIKEQTVSLYNLSKILNRVNEVTIGQTMTEELYNELLNEFKKAKKYEISADDSLIVNFYSLAPNTTYLSSINQNKSSIEKDKT